jgi:hypothetical protein
MLGANDFFIFVKMTANYLLVQKTRDRWCLSPGAWPSMCYTAEYVLHR